jgi:Tfp pilus assembly protein FimT
MHFEENSEDRIQIVDSAFVQTQQTIRMKNKIEQLAKSISAGRTVSNSDSNSDSNSETDTESKEKSDSESNSDTTSITESASKSNQTSDSESSDAKRPAIFLTGATHSRELITVQMPLYSSLKLLHKALVQNDERYQNLLMQNTYYVVPVINVDGLAQIEKDF